ncbi:MAG: hypothetical protein Q7R97_05440 [Candidatus Daviesbacteria bacterium]|nr:hypothetical protein [Candidatus Daviesbacteria bacterium]
MGKEQKYEKTFEGFYSSMGWGIGLEYKLRWLRGPQFGERSVSYPHVIDLKGQRHNLEPQRGLWTWYSWRFRRIEGPKAEFPPPITFCFDQEKETVGVELEGRPDVVTQKVAADEMKPMMGGLGLPGM